MKKNSGQKSRATVPLNQGGQPQEQWRELYIRVPTSVTVEIRDTRGISLRSSEGHFKLGTQPKEQWEILSLRGKYLRSRGK
jgi:hypothetical protein